MGRMAEQQRKLLEAMMGPEAMGVQVINLDWWSPKVCRNFLFGTCPHLIFGNTKMDLGQCPKTHSDRILKQFQEHQKADPSDPRIAAFKQEHEAAIFGFVEDCDRRIRAAQRKLEKTPEENRKTVDLMKEIGEIELSIQGGTEEIEALGEAGKVEESMEKLAAVDALKALKADKERELQNLNETAGASGHQKLRVCETCGAMLSVLDSDKRLADHFGGKLHLGYNELRNLLAKFAEERMTGRAQHNHNHAPPPSGPNAPPPSAPAASSYAPRPPSGLAPPPGFAAESTPHTPLHAPKVPPPDEMPIVGHGDKVKREAGELVEDIKEERERHERRDSRDGGRDRYREDRYERERDRDRDYRDRERGDRDSKYRDREREERGERSERSDRDRGDKYDRDRSSRYERDYRDRERDRDSRYDDDRRRDRSRSPSKRRLV